MKPDWRTQEVSIILLCCHQKHLLILDCVRSVLCWKTEGWHSFNRMSLWLNVSGNGFRRLILSQIISSCVAILNVMLYLSLPISLAISPNLIMWISHYQGSQFLNLLTIEYLHYSYFVARRANCLIPWRLSSG